MPATGCETVEEGELRIILVRVVTGNQKWIRYYNSKYKKNHM